jgi:hypothetical protein
MTVASSKRILFGMVFEGPRPAIDGSGFLKDLGVIDAEGAEKNGQQFILFTVARPRRTSEVQQAIDAYNDSSAEAMRLVQFEGERVVTFERGHRFQLHPIYQTIRTAETAKDNTFWSWSSTGVVGDANISRKRRRVINELESDLVEASIIPAAPKRASGKENRGEEPQPQVMSPHYGLLCIGMFAAVVELILACSARLTTPVGVLQIGKKQRSSKQTKKRSSTAVPSKQSSYRILDSSVDLMHLVKEVTRSKDETIRAKDQMIKLLETRKVCVCGNGLGAD